MGNFEDAVTREMLDDMVYLQAVVKESMRTKPPVTMVSHILSLWKLLVVILCPFLIGSLQSQEGIPDHRRLHGPRRQHGHPVLLQLPSRS